MARLISFNALKENSGKKTIALTFANKLAEIGQKVLLMDLDYKHSSYSTTYGLEHDEYNTESYFERSIQHGFFNIEDFSFKARESNTSESKSQRLKDYSPNLHFITMTGAKDLKKMQTNIVQTWNTEQCYNFMQRFLERIKNTTDYDYIVLVLPVGLEDMFNFPCLLASDLVYNVTKFNKEQVELTKAMMEALKYQDNDEESKFAHIVNEIPSNLDEYLIDQLFEPLFVDFKIEYCSERALREFQGVVGSKGIEQGVDVLIDDLGFETTHSTNNKQQNKSRLFGLLKG